MTWTPKNIRALRVRTGLSRNLFSIEVGVDVSTVYKWESEATKLRDPRLIAALDCLAAEYPEEEGEE